MIDSPLPKIGVPTAAAMSVPEGDANFGHLIGGVNPGPSILVAGHDPIASMVYNRLLKLPTLDRVRGRLMLVILGALDAGIATESLDMLGGSKPDEVVFLPYHLDPEYHESAADEGYWTVLRACTSLGMITGRGVPPTTPVV